MESVHINFERYQFDQIKNAPINNRRNSTTSSTNSPIDKVTLSTNAVEVSDSVSRLRSMEESRAQRVAYLKEQVQSGQYPSPEIITNLANILSGTGGNLGNQA